MNRALREQPTIGRLVGKLDALTRSSEYQRMLADHVTAAQRRIADGPVRPGPGLTLPAHHRVPVVIDATARRGCLAKHERRPRRRIDLMLVMHFHDLDVMGIGTVARQTSDVFDLFWNSGWVIHPNQATRDKAEAAAPSQRAAMERELRRSEELEHFSLSPRNWESEFSNLLPALHLGSSKVLTDRPGPDGISNDVYEWIIGTVPEIQQELLVTNAYLIPETSGVSLLAGLTEKGVDVQIHTNSLASHDVPAVNSHYKAWRTPMLEAGVSLFEARHDAEIKVSVVDTPPISAKYMGLHSKSMVIDRRFAVIGSANLDPRSAFLNSEMIAVIDSEGLAEELAQIILRDMAPSNSWEVKLDDDGKLQWQNDVETTQRQPTRDSFQPIADWFFMLFPRRFY